MPKIDPNSEQLLAKAKRFRDRAAGFRHTLARDDLARKHREELEQMVLNLEGAARQLEAMAGGAPVEASDLTAAEEIRRLRAGHDIPPERAALIRNARSVRNARVASQVLNAAARAVAKPGAGPRKRGA
jgi:hypothetical protein